jgi:chromosome segregation ATPase
VNAAREQRARVLQGTQALIRSMQSEHADKDGRIAALVVDLTAAQERIEELKTQLARAQEFQPKYEGLCEHLRSLGSETTG